MAVPYKKILRKNPRNMNEPGKYYLQLVNQGNSVNLEYIADVMQKASSLSPGDIKSVLDNFVEAMRMALFSGSSVNIKDFGVFSLTARTHGVAEKKECNVRCIKSLNINFRPSTSVKPALEGTRGINKLQFFDIEKGEIEEIDNGGGKGNEGDDFVDPKA